VVYNKSFKLSSRVEGFEGSFGEIIDKLIEIRKSSEPYAILQHRKSEYMHFLGISGFGSVNDDIIEISCCSPELIFNEGELFSFKEKENLRDAEFDPKEDQLIFGNKKELIKYFSIKMREYYSPERISEICEVDENAD